MKNIRIYIISMIAGVLICCCGCSVFSTPQERSGINPKPFNSQAGWETQPYGGRILY